MLVSVSCIKCNFFLYKKSVDFFKNLHCALVWRIWSEFEIIWISAEWSPAEKACTAEWLLLPKLHCKKKLAIFPSQPGVMSLQNSPWEGKIASLFLQCTHSTLSNNVRIKKWHKDNSLSNIGRLLAGINEFNFKLLK
jgi:hypothetical protein